jgi:hypothetical protein
VLLKYLVNPLKNHIHLKLISLSLALQLVSLFRNYPSNHPCGRVLEVVGQINVLINCDSSVYMKDAQDPSRLFNGESVYQDRPLPTLIVSALSKFWQSMNLPNFSRDIIGNSGNVTNYSLITYFFFILMSAAVLSLTCFIGINTLNELSKRFNVSEDLFVVVATIFVLLISMNELTKTFFWTPGSQMFNLLLPVYLFALVQKSQSRVSNKVFITSIIFFALLLFSYAFFILLIIPLLFLNWKNLKHRLFWITPIPVLYFLYPLLIELFGGKYYSFGFGDRRLYLWVIDSYFLGNLTERLREFFLYFIGTFPLIPSLFIFITIIYLSKNFLMDSKSIVVFRLELFIIFIYIILLAFYGYYSRRLTYPVYLFIYLVLLRSTITGVRSYRGSDVSIIASVIGVVSLVSWLFTLGPLV